MTSEKEREMDVAIHDILMIASVIKCFEHSLSPGQCKILDGCIVRLNEIRATLLKKME